MPQAKGLGLLGLVQIVQADSNHAVQISSSLVPAGVAVHKYGSIWQLPAHVYIDFRRSVCFSRGPLVNTFDYETIRIGLGASHQPSMLP